MVESHQESKRLKLPQKIDEMTSIYHVDESEISFLNTDTDGMSDPDLVEKIILTSYPRCGNTLLRTYLE
jgi:hypothetical protein